MDRAEHHSAQSRWRSSIFLTREIAVAGFSARSCSQILRTDQPAPLRRRPTCRSRLRFLCIFAFQNRRLACGIDRQRGHPCQKQPSTKTANCASVKRKSGCPGNLLFRPCFHPRTPLAASIARSRSSVDVLPCDRLSLITRDRDALSMLSKRFANHSESFCNCMA